MAEGRVEDSEILLQHAKIILTNLENAAAVLRDGGLLAKEIESDAGKKVQQYARDCAKAAETSRPIPAVNKAIEPNLRKLQKDLADVQKLIEYVFQWKRLASFQMQRLNHAVRELDMRWNFQMTKCVIELFVAVGKVCVFLHSIKHSLFVANLIYTAPVSGDGRAAPAEFLSFMNTVSQSPWQAIADTVGRIHPTIAMFLARHSQFYSVVFADWTFFDWSLLSIYEVAPDETVGQSMPKDEYIQLMYIGLFSDLVVLFLMTYPDYLKENQFAVLAGSVFSEYAKFYLSRMYSLDMIKLLEMRKDDACVKTLIAKYNVSKETKFKTTHLYRMMQLSYVLGDLENFAGMDKNQFMRTMHQTRAGCAFAYYEIEQFLGADDKSLYQGRHAAMAMKLIALIGKFMDFFIREKDEVERFFAFNLATADVNYLEKLTSLFGGSLKEADSIIEEVKKIGVELQTISLDEFDKGTRYDLYPLILTCGRLLKEYNVVYTGYHISHFNPLFEHLSTIVMHAYGCQDATSHFIEVCPMHTMWRFNKQLMEIIPVANVPIEDCMVAVEAFSYYNFDFIYLSASKEFRDYCGGIDKIKGELSKKLRSALTVQLKSDSRLMKFSITGEMGQPIQTEVLRDVLRNPEFCNKESDIVTWITGAHNFVYRVPDSVFLFSQDIPVAKSFSEVLGQSVDRILLMNELKHIGTVTDATELMWSLFGQLGSNYNRALFTGSLMHSFFTAGEFSKQADTFIGKSDVVFPPRSDWRDETRDVYAIAQQLIEFADGGHKKTKYIPFIQRFQAQGLVYSTQYFTRIIRTLGLHAALYLDFKITEHVCNKISQIMTTYTRVSPQLKAGRNLPLSLAKEHAMADATEAFLSMAVALVLRVMIRRAAQSVVNETIPGLAQLIGETVKTDTPAGAILTELFTTTKSHFFIVERLKCKAKTTFPGPLEQYFGFLAALFNNASLHSSAFFADKDALLNNYHVLPLAWEVMVDAVPAMFDKVTRVDIDKGISHFFSGLSQIYRSTYDSAATTCPLLIIVNGFMKLIPEMEFGRLEKVFPFAMISSGYPQEDAPKKPKKK